MKVNYNSTKKAQQPIIDAGLQVEYAQSKRSGYKKRWYMLLLLVSVPLTLLIWLALRPFILILAPGIITTEPLEVRAPSTAVISDVLIKGGKKVYSGEILLLLTDVELDAQIVELNLQLLELRNKPLSYDNSIIAGLNYRIKVAAEGVQRQDELLKSYQQFKLKGVVPTSDMAIVLQANTVAKMTLEQAKVDLLHEKTKQQLQNRAGFIRQQKDRLKLQLAKLIAKQQALIIKSSFSGHVEDILVQRGEHIAEGQPLLWISSREKPIVITYVDAKYLNYVALGQMATVKLANGDSYRAEILHPTELVSKIPAQLSGPFDGQKSGLKVKLTLLDELPFAIEGVPVEVSFDYF